MGDANLVAELLEAVRKTKPRALSKLLSAKDNARKNALKTAESLGHSAAAAVLTEWRDHPKWMATVSLARRRAAAAADADAIVGQRVHIAGRGCGTVNSCKRGQFLGFGPSMHTVQLDSAADRTTEKLLLLRHANGGVPFVLLGGSDDDDDDDDGGGGGGAAAAASAKPVLVAGQPGWRKPAPIIVLERQLRKEQAEFGPEHSNVGLTLAKIGKAWLATPEVDRALEELEHSRAILESVLAGSGVDDTDLAKRFTGVLEDLVAAYERVGDTLKVVELKEALRDARRY